MMRTLCSKLDPLDCFYRSVRRNQINNAERKARQLLATTYRVSSRETVDSVFLSPVVMRQLRPNESISEFEYER